VDKNILGGFVCGVNASFNCKVDFVDFTVNVLEHSDEVSTWIKILFSEAYF
jgi:hypothetical protein